MIVLPELIPGEYLYQQIYEQLKKQIQSGLLPAGEKLPSKRVLANRLCISINTVDTAYVQLEMEGFVEIRPRSGVYVLPVETVYTVAAKPSNIRTLPESEHTAAEIDFSPSAVAIEKFPFTHWQRCLRICLDKREVLKRTPPQGDPGLRKTVAEYLYRERGVQCTPEQVIIGAGTDNLLEILGYILENACTLAVENPVYNDAYQLFARMGHPVIPAEVDRHGVMAEPLETLDNVILYMTPSHQYPLGISMPAGRRVQLLNWAGRGDFRYIIEDDYDSEFRYDARPLPSLQSMDKNQRVIYLRSFSRAISPALRLSVMVLPPELLERYQALYSRFASRVSTLEQLALGEFMEQGYFETHLNRMRTYYKNKCRLLLQGLQPLADQLERVGELAGQHLTVRLTNGLQEEELCRRAREVGVRVYPVTPFFMGQTSMRDKVLMGFGGLTDAEISEGTKRLTNVWKR